MTYEVREELPTVERFQELRAAADMAARSREGAERGLSNSVFGVTVVDESADETVGMARIVGDVHESEALVQCGRRCASSVHTRTALLFWGQPIRNAKRF